MIKKAVLPLFVLCLTLSGTTQLFAQAAKETHPVQVALIYQNMLDQPPPFETWAATSQAVSAAPDWAKNVVAKSEEIKLIERFSDLTGREIILAFDELRLTEIDRDDDTFTFERVGNRPYYTFVTDFGAYAVFINNMDQATTRPVISAADQYRLRSKFNQNLTVAAEFDIEPIEAAPVDELFVAENGREYHKIVGAYKSLRIYGFENGEKLYGGTILAESVESSDRVEEALQKYVETSAGR